MALLDEIDKLRSQVRDFDLAVYQLQSGRVQAFAIMERRARMWAQAAWDMHSMYPRDALLYRTEAEQAETRADMLRDIAELESATLKMLAKRLERYQ